MQRLSDVLVEELDPETQAVCDEVCGALAAATSDDPWAEPDYRGLPNFGRDWGVAFTRCGDHVCRQRIIDALEQRVRNDPDLWMAQGGTVLSRAVIRQHQGRESYVVDSQTGEMRQMIEWPTGTYAGGAPSYERPEAA